MRALLDANIYISYLLIPSGRRNPNIIMEAVFSGALTVLLSDRLIAELTRRVAMKPYLAQRIDASDIDELRDALQAVSELMPELRDRIPDVSRDRKDDYLLAHAVLERPDYLVTGDDDLLSLVGIEGVKIVSPADFVRLLEDRAADDPAAGPDLRFR